MPSRRTSRTHLQAWTVPVLALVGYAAAATVVLSLRGGSLTAPGWGPALALLVYLIVAIVTVRSFSVSRVLMATAAFSLTQGLLLVVTVAVVAVVAPDVRPPFWSAALGMLILVSVPLLLAPVRFREQPPAGSSRGSGSTAVRSASARDRAVPPASRIASGPAATSRPWPAPSPGPLRPDNSLPLEHAAVKPWTFAGPAASPPPAPLPTTHSNPSARAPVATPPRPPASSRPPAPTRVPAAPATVPPVHAAESVEGIIRIPFARVADQLPEEVFALPRDQVGAHLQEADFLLVPERLVRPQLVEGLVQVGWPLVAEQFPRQTLALSDKDVVQLLPNGALVLPLDEVVRQVPSGLFALSASTMDAQALEDFPLPFQPDPSPTTSDEPDGPMEDRAPESLAPGAEPVNRSEPPVPGVEAGLEWAPEPERAAEPETDWSPESVAAEPAEWAPEPERARDPLTDVVPETSAVAADPLPSDEPGAQDARRMAVLLGPLLSPMTVENVERAGASFLTLAPPTVAGATVADVAARVLPSLIDPRLPERAVQATVRGTAMTVVITPLVGAPDMALAAATPPGASLALLERLCLKEAAVPETEARPMTLVPAASLEAELREAPPEPAVRRVAASLHAFGRVTSSVLRDPDGSLVVYLFLPRYLEARAFGGFARDLHRALVGSPAGPITSVVVKVGTHRLMVRAVENARGAVLVAGGGPVERPGLARLELERAAAYLGRL